MSPLGKKTHPSGKPEPAAEIRVRVGQKRIVCEEARVPRANGGARDDGVPVRVERAGEGPAPSVHEARDAGARDGAEPRVVSPAGSRGARRDDGARAVGGERRHAPRRARPLRRQVEETKPPVRRPGDDGGVERSGATLASVEPG